MTDMTFREFILAENNGGYIALSVTPSDSARITATLAEYLPEDVVIPNMHLTLMFDVSNPTIDIGVVENTTYIVKVVDIAVLGDKDSVVLKVESLSVAARFKELQNYGFKHSFDNLLQHISVVYDASIDVISVILKNKEHIIEQLNSLELNGEYRELTAIQ